MKILFPIGFFYPSQSGPGNSIYWLAKALLKNNIKVTEIAMDYEIPVSVPRDKWMDTNYGRVKYIKTWNYVLGLRYVWFAFLESRNAKIIHLNSIFAPSSLFIGTLVSLFRKEVLIVWSVRGELAPFSLTSKPGIKKIIIFFLKRILNSRIAFHATCDVETRYIKQNFGSQIRVIEIPNLLELPDCLHSDKQKYLLFLGRINPIKALESLIRAVKISSQFTLSNYKLYFAGHADNDYGKALQQLIFSLDLGDRVQFIGPVDGTVKQEVLAAARCLILPSYTENFGNVVIESLAQKTPVIAAKGTPWAILETEKAGLWVENTPEKLALAIDEILEMQETEYQQMCNNALDLVQREFEVDNNVHRWISAYQQLIN